MYAILTEVYEKGKLVSVSRSAKPYIRRGNAERAARQLWTSRGDLTFKTTIVPYSNIKVN